MSSNDSQLMTKQRSHVFTKQLGILDVKPHEEPHISLGIFNEETSPKGFSIQVDTPDPSSVVAQIATFKMGRRYEVVLEMVNKGDKAVHAEVWGF